MGQEKILVVGANPALDHYYSVDNFHQGNDFRSHYEKVLAGGKAMNVARCLSRLGCTNINLIAPLDNYSRWFFINSCRDLDISLEVFPLEEITRSCIIINDFAGKTYTLINPPGPEVSEREAKELWHFTHDLLRDSRIVLASGSLPPGLGNDFYAKISLACSNLNIPFIADTSGIPLQRVLETNPWGIKINEEELFGVSPGAEVKTAAINLSQKYQIKNLIVTLGKEGSLYIGKQGQFTVPGVKVDCIDPNAAGDNFLGGLVASLLEGGNFNKALKHASVVAGLAVTKVGPDIGKSPSVSLPN